jgi:hypothetical protein
VLVPRLYSWTTEIGPLASTSVLLTFRFAPVKNELGVLIDEREGVNFEGFWAISPPGATLWQVNKGTQALYLRGRVWFKRAGSPSGAG